MKRLFVFQLVAFLFLVFSLHVQADLFGTGVNQFIIDFVPISYTTNPNSGYGIVNNEYRMGTYEITNDQWDKFTASQTAPVTGADGGYNYNSFYTGANIPANKVSWFEAAQFVNWLNTSTGHQAAYKFTGTQGTSDYSLAIWSSAEAANGTNLYRHKDAFYFLPTEDEWMKAAYWNGDSLQGWATKDGNYPVRGDGSGTGWNFWNGSSFQLPWAVGSGSQELNGTYDMMGNLWEWVESPFTSGDYSAGSTRVYRSGSCDYEAYHFYSLYREPFGYYPQDESSSFGFRVASVPEPSTLALLFAAALSGLVYWRRSR